MINSESLKAKIIEHMESDKTVEQCGLVVESGGFLKYFPCRNSHLLPADNFMIDSKDYLIASMAGEIKYVVHSHTENGLPHLSMNDIYCQYQEQLPWILYSPHDPQKLTVYAPVPKLKGREFIEGQRDCYDAMKDFYALAGHKMGNYGPEVGLRIDGWYREEGVESPFLQNIENEGFERVPFIKDIQPGDVILALFGAQVPNHCLVYVGDNKVFHHLPGKLSAVELLRSFWVSYSHSIWRYHDRDSLDIERALNALNEDSF